MLYLQATGEGLSKVIQKAEKAGIAYSLGNIVSVAHRNCRYPEWSYSNSLIHYSFFDLVSKL